MKTCQEIQLRLDDLRSGQLDADLRRAVLAHLETCAVCRAFYDLDEDLRDELADLPLVACPERVSEGILAQIADETQSMKMRPNATRPAHRRTGGTTLRPRTWLPTAALLAAARRAAGRPASGTQPPAVAGIRHAGRLPRRRNHRRLRRRPEGVGAAARIIEQSERTTLQDVLGRQLPGSITGPLRDAFADRQGGRG